MPNAPGPSQDHLTGTPHAAVLVAEGSEEIEFITPCDVLVRAGCVVTTIGVDTLTPTGSRGIPLRASREIHDCLGEHFDAVVLPGGGPGADAFAKSEPTQRFILDHAARIHHESRVGGGVPKGLILGAICAAPAVVLGPLGLLNGRRATGYPSTKDRFPESAVYVDKPVVVDGPLITSRGPGTAMLFALALARALRGEAVANAVAEEMLFITE